MYINNILYKYLNKFYIAYLNNIIIFSETLKKHKNYLLRVVTCLADTRLSIDILKSKFIKLEVKFLRLIITSKGIKIDLEKI